LTDPLQAVVDVADGAVRVRSLGAQALLDRDEIATSAVQPAQQVFMGLSPHRIASC
jgi:hypothetical protein